MSQIAAIGGAAADGGPDEVGGGGADGGSDGGDGGVAADPCRRLRGVDFLPSYSPSTIQQDDSNQIGTATPGSVTRQSCTGTGGLQRTSGPDDGSKPAAAFARNR